MSIDSDSSGSTAGGPLATGGAEVLSPDDVESADSERPTGGEDEGESSGIDSPGKIIRIGAMVKQLLEELRDTELDEPSRDQLRDIYRNSVTELKTAMSPELAEELDQLSFVFEGDDLPSGVELRMAKAQLVGWLEGLFHGMQAALMAQQMNMRQQLEGMRQQLPETTGPHGRGGPGYL